jgi:hypothetical protein
VCKRDRDQRQRRKQDRGEAAVEKLFTPVDESVVRSEQDNADPKDEQPFAARARPSRAEYGDDDGQHAAGYDKSQCRDIERAEAAVADLDHEPRRAPDHAEQDVESNARHRHIVAVQCAYALREEETW